MVSRHKILIVDDTLPNRQLLREILLDAKEGYLVAEASGGLEAIEMVRHDAPDILLLDIQMPDMDGFKVCAALKEDERYKDIPIVFITALVDSEDKVKGFAVGGADYITK
ncbi:MAG: response regulator, partial [Candidatus Omnitrophica bacterium]|nr:response regulator [Candidatus Omnitrophota bacterium]